MLNQKIYYSYKKKRRVNNFIMLKIASYSIKDKFYLVRGKDVREINIAEAYEAIGPESASAILGFHSFTGCDFTAKFNGKSKKSAWKLFLDSNTDIKRAFTELSSHTTPVEQFVVSKITY